MVPLYPMRQLNSSILQLCDFLNILHIELLPTNHLHFQIHKSLSAIGHIRIGAPFPP